MGKRTKKIGKDRRWAERFTKAVNEGDPGSRPKSHKTEPTLPNPPKRKKPSDNPKKRLFGGGAT